MKKGVKSTTKIPPVKISYFGHSTYLLEIEGSKILFDPFISPNELAKEIDISTIECDFILVSHGHSDHIADVVSIAERTGAKIVCNFEVAAWFKKKGLNNIHDLNHGGSVQLAFGTVKYVNAVHSSSLPDGSYGGNAGGFIIQAGGHTIYYAGDTALTMDMKLFGQLYAIDLAFLPIGDNYTMGIDDAIVAADFINCKNIIGMHYNTFSAIKIDMEDAKTKFEKAGLDLTLLKIGQTIDQ